MRGNMSGWIKLQRKMINWEWFTDVNTCHLFTYLLLAANYQTTKWRGHTILPGQLMTGRIALARATGLSEQNVRTSLEKLKITNEITSELFNKYSIITITNWKEYQDINQQLTSESTSELTNKQPANQPTTNHIQESKEDKKEKKIRNIEALPLPDWLPLDEWNGFLEVRKKKNKMPTNRAIQMLIVKIDELRKQGHDPTAVINQSIINSWSGFFEIKGNRNENIIGNDGNYNKQSQGTTYNDKHQRTLEAAARGHARAQNPDF